LTDLESSRAPVDKLDVAFGLDGSNSIVDVLWHHVTSVKQTARHVLAVTRIALHHLMGRLEARVRDLGDAVLLVVSLLGRHDRSVGGQREVDARIWNEVGLEFGQVDVQSSVETQRRRDRTHHLKTHTHN